MNSTIPKRHARMLRNRNVLFQSKNRNDDWNGIDNYASSFSHVNRLLPAFSLVELVIN